jgi:hypothetical protein|tara:strand:- start:383 stop:655 length:273 start_codon:yes stop_codon:yes gene_type:complete
MEIYLKEEREIKMRNPHNKKYILQETRGLKANEFVYSRNSHYCACKDTEFWDHLFKVHGIFHENIDEINLPDDAQGERMWGIRVKACKDE